jgi:exosome complex component RRP4
MDDVWRGRGRIAEGEAGRQIPPAGEGRGSGDRREAAREPELRQEGGREGPTPEGSGERPLPERSPEGERREGARPEWREHGGRDRGREGGWRRDNFQGREGEPRRDDARGQEGARGSERPREVERQLVLPGELLATGNVKGGNGTYKDGDGLYAGCLGIKSSRDGFVSVIPLSGKYIPRRGDFVVGKVVEMTPSAWVIDLNSPYVAPLPGSETPWDVQFGEAKKFMGIGDTVLVEIRDVDDMKKVSVTMNGPNLRKMVGGQTIDVDATKVPRIIGRGGSMIGLLKRLTRCHIIVGQNGRIWLDGTVEDLNLALAAIRKIEADAHKLGLTDAIASFIEGMRRDVEAQRARKEKAAETKEKEAIMWNNVERIEHMEDQKEE